MLVTPPPVFSLLFFANHIAAHHGAPAHDIFARLFHTKRGPMATRRFASQIRYAIDSLKVVGTTSSRPATRGCPMFRSDAPCACLRCRFHRYSKKCVACSKHYEICACAAPLPRHLQHAFVPFRAAARRATVDFLKEGAGLGRTATRDATEPRRLIVGCVPQHRLCAPARCSAGANAAFACHSSCESIDP